MYKVLIVDDDKLARKGIISIVPWEECGLEVAGDVANGALALEFVENHAVDLAIVDLAMPVLSGLEFIRECRQRRPEIQYIVLTAYESFEYIQKALRLGVLDYISKLQMDQEDCVKLFKQAAERIRQRKQLWPAAVKDNEKEMNRCYQQIDGLYCFYNREQMEELRRDMELAGFHERERYRLMLHVLHVMERNFSIRLREEEFESGREDCGWLIEQENALIREARRMEGTGGGNIQLSVLRACIYIKEHLEEHELSAEAVGNELNISRSYFSTSFKKYTGHSINSYIRKERVERAKEIMEREPQLSFGDVVYRVGYLNEKYFAKIFQEKEGVTFAEYRRRLGVFRTL